MFKRVPVFVVHNGDGIHVTALLDSSVTFATIGVRVGLEASVEKWQCCAHVESNWQLTRFEVSEGIECSIKRIIKKNTVSQAVLQVEIKESG